MELPAPSVPLQRARTAIVQSISDEMVASLCRDTLAATATSRGADGGNTQEHEHQVLSTVHTALHQILAAARAAPLQDVLGDGAALAPNAFDGVDVERDAPTPDPGPK
jgi:hypothetical protein